MAPRLLHGVIDAKILEAVLSDGQPQPAATKSQNVTRRKILALIKNLTIFWNCQRFDKSTSSGGGGHHAAGKSVYAAIGMDTAACIVAQTRAVDAGKSHPQWKEEPLHVYCAHNASDVVFTVFSADGAGASVVGHAYLPVEDIAGGQQVDRWLPICDAKRKPLDGLDRVHVQLRFTDVAADEESRWGRGIYGGGAVFPGVPRSFFGMHRGCRVTLYRDAQAAQPSGGRCWEDIFAAVANARRLVYVAGWSVDTGVALVRDLSRPAETLGQLLKRKAGDGVTVLMLVWDRHGEDTASYFRGTGVHCVLCPRNGGDSDAAAAAMFTHHQKAVVVDGPRGLVGFLGGIDLCGGRYDTPEHPLFRTLSTTHRDDFHQPSFPGASVQKGGPREPWHDVHCRVEGPAAWDVLDNFEQRWRKQGGAGAGDQLVQLPRSSAAREVGDQADGESWNVQVFRSIDSAAVAGFPATPDEAALCGLATGNDHGGAVERSIQDAYIHAIRRAKYFVYLETHCFLGSSYGWLPRDDGDGAAADVALHLIPRELSLKIASKIKTRDNFRVYVVVPMWPEGSPESAPVQDILHWQRRTMEMMYKDVAAALSAAGLSNNPRDYLSFFCLGNREPYTSGEHAPPEKPEPGSDYMRAQKARRFKINVNANTMIVDDEYIMVGSANVNQRSMDGGRDTEMAVGAYQPRHLDTSSSWPKGKVHEFRVALWREHLGQTATARLGDDELYPVRLGCMSKVNQMARENWEKYTSEAFQDSLPGHLMAYPVSVGDRGELRETVAFFPDTKAGVFGSCSPTLAPVLTT